MPMTPLPTAPSTSRPSVFAAEADALLGALATFVTEANALETAVDANKTAAAGSASAASTSASTATTQAGIATTKAGEASGFANAAAASAAAAAGSASTSAGWSATSTTSMALTAGSKSLTIQTGKQFTAGTNIKVKRTSDPDASHAFTTVSTYTSGTGVLEFTLDADLITGSGTYTDWTVELSGARGATGPIGTGVTDQTVGFTVTGGTSPKTLTVDADVTVSDLFSKITRAARTSNTALTSADKGAFIEITANTFTQTFTAAATLGAGWFCYLYNSGTGDITLDPNGSEQIDGLTSYVMYPGEARLVLCTGTAFETVVLKTFLKEFTASGTFTKPPGYEGFEGLLWGGGGGGGGVDNSGSYNAGHGGGGACVPLTYKASALSATETVTIGAGGTGGGNHQQGQAGGSSTFKGVTAYGGGGGYAGWSVIGGGGGGGGLHGPGGSTTTTNGGAAGAPFSAGDRDNIGFGGGLGGSSGSTTTGGTAIYGGGGGGSGNGSGGASIYGGGGGGGGGGQSKFGGNGGNAGANGTQPGGGGGGMYASGYGTPGGSGGAGMLRIWGIC